MAALRKHAFRAVVDALKARGKTVAVVESTCGGLIQSSIMSVDGSSSVYYGGSVAYNTKRCKPILLNDEALHASLPGSAGDAASYKASKLDWTAKTAAAYAEAMGTDYAVAEGGARRTWSCSQRPAREPWMFRGRVAATPRVPRG